MFIPNLNLKLPELKEHTSISVFRLIQTSSISVQQLNKGYNENNDISVGFFHVVGYNPELDTYLFAKPVQEINEPKLQCFTVTRDFINEWFTSLLVFNINNN